ncbi:MAG: PqqD family protein [Candidatus Omnitrophota bacterium]
MDEKRVFRKNKDMVHRVIGAETILLPVYKRSEEINCVYTLNPSAAWVWDMIDGKKTFGQIKRKAVGSFKTEGSEVEKKIGKLFGELEQIAAIV